MGRSYGGDRLVRRGMVVALWDGKVWSRTRFVEFIGSTRVSAGRARGIFCADVGRVSRPRMSSVSRSMGFLTPCIKWYAVHQTWRGHALCAVSLVLLSPSSFSTHCLQVSLRLCVLVSDSPVSGRSSIPCYRRTQVRPTALTYHILQPQSKISYLGPGRGKDIAPQARCCNPSPRSRIG